MIIAGSVDKIGLEGDPGDPHAHGGAQPTVVGDAQRPQHLEAARVERAEERFWHVYVPDQHGPDAEPGGLRNGRGRAQRGRMPRAAMANLGSVRFNKFRLVSQL